MHCFHEVKTKEDRECAGIVFRGTFLTTCSSGRNFPYGATFSFVFGSSSRPKGFQTKNFRSIASLKATSHSGIFRACMHAIKDPDGVFGCFRLPALHVFVTIPLNFAICTHPTQLGLHHAICLTEFFGFKLVHYLTFKQKPIRSQKHQTFWKRTDSKRSVMPLDIL